MDLIQWEESMSVGMEEMDEQHRQLILLINETYQAVQRHDEHKMDVLIAKMADYARMHFADEEALLEEHGYPDLALHRTLHGRFIADVNEFRKNRFHRTNLSQIFVFLSRWLTSHIMDEDRKYTAYMPKDQPDERA